MRTTGSSRGWLWLLLSAALLVFVSGEVLFWLNKARGEPAYAESWFILGTSLVESALGLMILRRVPGQPIGMLLYVIGMLLGASYFLDEYAIYALRTEPGSLPLARYAIAIEVIGSAAFGLTGAYLPLLFPHGRLPSPRWRWPASAAAVAIALTAGVGMLRPFSPPFQAWDNPLAIESANTAVDAISAASLLFVAAFSLAGFVSLVLRFREADGIEQRQLEWFAIGGVILLAVSAISAVLTIADMSSDTVKAVLFSLGFTAIPASVAIAILRYRLYDIDWIVNRTLVYVPLTAILAGLYVATTGLVRTLFTEATSQHSDVSVALSTLAVTGLFTPVKNYLQAAVDRRFKDTGAPSDAVKRLAAEARTVAGVMRRNAFLPRYLNELTTAFQATGGTVRYGEEVYVQGTWLGEDDLALEFTDDVGSVFVALGPPKGPEPYSEHDKAQFIEYASVLVEMATVWRGEAAGDLIERASTPVTTFDPKTTPS